MAASHKHITTAIIHQQKQQQQQQQPWPKWQEKNGRVHPGHTRGWLAEGDTVSRNNGENGKWFNARKYIRIYVLAEQCDKRMLLRSENMVRARSAIYIYTYTHTHQHILRAFVHLFAYPFIWICTVIPHLLSNTKNICVCNACWIWIAACLRAIPC